MAALFQGPLAALLTPRENGGAVDFEAFGRNVELLLGAGGTGIVVAGGTGEYADLTIEDRKALTEIAAAIIGTRGALIPSIGSMRLNETVELAEQAFDLGAPAVLLPPPHFYRYEQPDLDAYFRAAAERIPGPVLLYNLAAFCSPIEPETIVRLIESVENIIGVKDSSGSLASLEMLTARTDIESCRILGHDKVLAEALRRGVIDAVISGPTSVVPEITVRLFATKAADDSDGFEAAAALFDELIARLGPIPYPWALKVIAEQRGLFPAEFPFPTSEARKEELRQFVDWFVEWFSRVENLG